MTTVSTRVKNTRIIYVLVARGPCLRGIYSVQATQLDNENILDLPE